MAQGPRGHAGPHSPEHQVPVLQAEPHEVFGFAVLLRVQGGGERGGDVPVPSPPRGGVPAVSPCSPPRATAAARRRCLSAAPARSPPARQAGCNETGPAVAAVPEEGTTPRVQECNGCKDATGARMQQRRGYRTAAGATSSRVQWVQQCSGCNDNGCNNATGAATQWVQ